MKTESTMGVAIIVEDFKLIADIWETVLQEEGFGFIEIIRHSDEVEDRVRKLNPDIILMDINLPGKKNGIELTESICKENGSLKVMMLTIHTEPTYIQKALNAGARAYVTKNSSISELKKAIKEVLAGNIYLCDEVKSHN